MIVKVAPLGERVVEVNVEPSVTVAEVLELAGVDLNGRTIRVDNVEADEDTKITREGAVITLTAAMKGGK